METIEKTANIELSRLNIHYLTVAKEQLIADPVKAKHSLGLDDRSADFIKSLTALDIQKLAESGVSAIKFRFEENSFPFLTNYMDGDDLAITQAILGGGA